MAMTSSSTPDPSLSQGHWIIDGRGWSFSGIIYDTTAIQHKNMILDPANIKLFEYTNQWNSLVLTGQLVYQDTERDMGKLFRIPHLVLRVEWAENEAKLKKKLDEDGFVESEYWAEKSIKKEDYFHHMFLVNKMEIIEHEIHSDITTYRLELVSVSWYKLSQVCQYSNYNLKKPEPITDIICRLLVDAVGIESVATKTFKEAPCKTDVCIYYTTTQKDNYFTAINYLLNRMYMEPSSFDVDNHPRIILWDEKESKYRMAKLNDDTTCLTVKDSLMQLNRFYDISDTEINPYMPGYGEIHAIRPTISSFSKMSYTRFIKDYYTRHYWDLNINKEKFVRRIIMNEKIHNLFKSPNADPVKRDSTFYPNPNITAEEDMPDLQFLLGNKTNYLVDECKWNNQRHLYNDCIQGIANRDTFIMTRENRVCHQPWQCFYLLRDKDAMQEKMIVDMSKNEDSANSESSNGSTTTANASTSESTTDTSTTQDIDTSKTSEKTKKNEFSDNQFFGPWFTFKTTHTIMISGTVKEGVPTMVERLQLIKPWEIAPVPQKLRK